MPDIKKRNSTIDLLRFITCPFILLIHCPLPGIIGEAIIHFGRYGVPFFLLLSGWFSFTPCTEDMMNRAKKKLSDTVKLIGSFFVAYFIMNSISAIISGKMFLSWVATYCDFKNMAYLFLFNRALFLGSTGYYPFMLVYVYLIFILLVRYNFLRKAFYIIPVLLVTNVFLGAFTNIPWFCYGNFLFTGLPFFLLGHWLHEINHKLPQNTIVWGCVFGFGTILTFVEAFANRPAYCFAGTILMAVALLMFSINCNFEVRNQALLRILQRYSVYIFVVHCGVRDVIAAFLERQQISYSPYTLLWMVISCSLLVCVAWDYSSIKCKGWNRKHAQDKQLNS